MRIPEEQLWDLERSVEDGVRYLCLRDGEELTKHYKMTFPSPAQEQAANLAVHKFRSELCKDKSLRHRWDLEKENKDALKEIRAEKFNMRRTLDTLKREWLQREVGGMPDVEIDQDASNEYVQETTLTLQRLDEEFTNLLGIERSLLSSCVEQMEQEHRIAILTQQCWYCQVKDDQWENVWATFDDFQNDQSSLTRRLMNETMLWAGGAGPFFGT